MWRCDVMESRNHIALKVETHQVKGGRQRETVKRRKKGVCVWGGRGAGGGGGGEGGEGRGKKGMRGLYL